MPRKRLVLIDGYSLLFRAFYGTRFLSTTAGRPTNALFGFTSMLFSLLQEQKPDAVVVALDAPGKTFRHAEYAEYKGTRRETPAELRSQLQESRALIEAFNIPTLEATGYEADDVVGAVSRLAEANGYDTTIVTGDLDALQLVDDCVQVMTTRKGVSDVVVYGPKEVRERYQFDAGLVPDYKALVGDASDNIPGVPGIGPKGATELITAFGAVENMIERLAELPEKYRKKIEPNVETMRRSKWLATIVRDAPIEYDFAPYQMPEEHIQRAEAMMQELEFRQHARRVRTVLGRYMTGEAAKAEPVAVVSQPVEARLAPAPLAFDALKAWVAGRPYAVVFEEGAAQLSMFEEAAPSQAYVAVGNEVRRAPAEAATRLFGEDPSLAVVHDAKPLYHKVPPTLTPPRFDSMLAGYVLQSGRSGYALSSLAQGYLDAAVPERPEQRAVALGMLEPAMRARLSQEGQARVLDEIELPVMPILAEMERLGIEVSGEVLEQFSRSLESDIAGAQQRAWEMAGTEFNIGSPKQIGEVLFEKLQIPGPKKTKTGYATGAEVLNDLAPSYPIVTEILTWRELTKLKGTYADALPKMIVDGRIHTTFNQAVAATGRLSSNDPNLQNIPIRTELGRQIRKAFVARPGYVLGSFDYSQIELRVLASMSGDKALVEAFRTGADVHAATAALMFGLEPGQVTKDQRGQAKMLNYAVLYGVTDYGLAAQLGSGFSISEAKELIRQYRERFPAVLEFMNGVVEDARRRGFTTTLCGRRRYFPEIHTANRPMRQYAERQAMNAPIQGTSADMIKLAMVRARKVLGDGPTQMILQVHDELLFEMAPGYEALVGPLHEAMVSALPLEVPVEADAKFGQNWLDMSAL